MRSLLEDGVREVEGAPPAWYGYPTWSDYDLKGKIRELGSHRALFVRRENRQKEQQEWLANEGAQEELRRCIQAVLSHVYEKHEEVSGAGSAAGAAGSACWIGHRAQLLLQLVPQGAPAPIPGCMCLSPHPICPACLPACLPTLPSLSAGPLHRPVPQGGVRGAAGGTLLR